MEPSLEIRLFGEPSFAFGGALWPFVAPPRALPLLAFLILHAGEPISRARLAELFWPDELDDVARSNLRRHLHHIVRALPAIPGVTWLPSTRATIAWNQHAPAWVDVVEFTRLASDPQTLAQAVELYRGDVVETLHDEWVLGEQGRFRATALSAMYDLATLARSRREYAEAVMRAERILEIDEWREDALRVLMAARYESGDRAAALAAYERFAMRLHAEMQVEPMPETTALRNLIVSEQPLESGSELAPAPSSENAGRAFHLPFVGRDDALERLRATWMRAAHKTGTLVFVAGEPGIGKSRLAAELASVVESQGGRTLIGLTSSPERSPYQPLVDAVRRGLPYLAKAAIDPIWLSVLASLVPEVLGVRPGLAAAEAIEPRAARARLHEAFARAFECIARTRPMLIVVEDLHWAQADTIDALAFLARRVGGMPILILALYRDENLDDAHPLRDARRTLQSERRATTVALARLNADDVTSLVARSIAATNASPQLAEAIFRVSEGNPLFASQLLQEYVEVGAMPNEGGTIRELADTITGRVERLDRQTRTVAEVAATIGRDFSAELVCGAGGWSEDIVLDALGLLMDRALVRETGAPGFEYCFTHVLIANAVYDRTDQALRPKRHRRIAQLLARMGNDPNVYGAIAHHYERAGEREAAGRAYLEAARSALTIYARGDAIDLARRALALVDTDADRFEALRLSLSSQSRYGDTVHMRDEVDRIEDVAQRLGAVEQFTALELRHDHAFIACDRDRQGATIDAMLALAEREGNANWRARALYSRATLLMGLGRMLEAEAPLREALNLAIIPPDPDLTARIRQRLVQVLSRRGEFGAALRELEVHRLATREAPPNSQERLHLLTAEAALAEMAEDPEFTLRVCTELLDVAVRLGDVDNEAKAHGQLAHAAHQRFECSAMREHYTRSAELFSARQHRQNYAVTLGNRGALEREIGNLDETIRLCTEVGALMAEVKSIDGLCTSAVNIGEAEFLRGNTEEALALVKTGLGYAIETGEMRLVTEAQIIYGTILCACGDSELGLEQLREGVALRRGLESPRSLSDDLCTLIEALLDAEQPDEVPPLVQELESLFATGLARQRFPGRVCWILSRAHRIAGDANVADEWLARGRAILDDQLARFDDPADVHRFRAMSFNRALTEPQATVRERPTPSRR